MSKWIFENKFYIGIIIMCNIIAVILHVGFMNTVNVWIFVPADIAGLALIKLSFNTAKLIKEKHPLFAYLLYFWGGSGILTLIFINIMFFMGKL